MDALSQGAAAKPAAAETPGVEPGSGTELSDVIDSLMDGQAAPAKSGVPAGGKADPEQGASGPPAAAAPLDIKSFM